jgi:hypothetical protein
METGNFLSIFLKDLANGVSTNNNNNSGIRFIKENGQSCTNPSQYPIIFRVPKTTTINRLLELDLVATSGYSYEVKLKNQSNDVVLNLTGNISPNNFSLVPFTAPNLAGIYYLELKVNGNLQGTLSLNVKSAIPQSFTEFTDEWNDAESYQIISDDCN